MVGDVQVDVTIEEILGIINDEASALSSAASAFAGTAFEPAYLIGLLAVMDE